MRIEWDERKRVTNLRKHQLDFADAWKIFLRPVLTVLDEHSTEYGEERWIGIGLMDETRVVVIVYTEPQEDTVRIISFRKALSYERERYQQAFRDEFGAL